MPCSTSRGTLPSCEMRMQLSSSSMHFTISYFSRSSLSLMRQASMSITCPTNYSVKMAKGYTLLSGR
jgi:hypothetical protein